MPASPRTERARELRKNTTVTERRLWSRLRNRQVDGWRFRRQHPIGDYVVDFYVPAARLIVELDGSSHDHEAHFDYDQRRKRWLESQGYKVLTFSADYFEKDYLVGVWDTIQDELTNLPGRAAPPALRATSPRGGEEIGSTAVQPGSPPALRDTSPRGGEDKTDQPIRVAPPALRATSPRGGEEIGSTAVQPDSAPALRDTSPLGGEDKTAQPGRVAPPALRATSPRSGEDIF